MFFTHHSIPYPNKHFYLHVDVELGILNDDAEIDLELFLRTIRWLKDEMRNQEEVLNTIKWGF